MLRLSSACCALALTALAIVAFAAVGAHRAGAATPAAPDASFTFSPASPATGQEVTFDGRSSTCAATPCTYTWVDVGAGGTGSWPLGSGQTMVFTFQGVGTKYVRLTVRDSQGRSASSNQNVVVAASPPPPDTTPPDTTITSSGPADSSSTSTSLSFTSSEAGSTFECRLDVGAFDPCSSPKSYTGLSVGAHTFDVRATDTAGNVDLSPASRAWNVLAQGACDRSATPSTFAAQFSAATAGQTVCLASGNYGTFTGAMKSGMVTLKAQAGATPSISLDFNPAANITLDGLSIGDSTVFNSTHDITIRNSTFTDVIRFDGLVNANVLLDNNKHNNINACNGCAPARIWLSYPSSQPSGVTVQNSTMIGGSTDGVQAGPAVNLLNNVLGNITEGSCSLCHTDAIQLYSGGGDGVGSVIKGNYLYNNATAIVQYDGGGYNVVEDNVVVRGNGRSETFIFGGDTNSIVRHNATDGEMNFTSKARMTSRGEVVKDNITTRIGTSNGVGGNAQLAENTNNMLRNGGSGGNFTGTPVYVGGGNPSTYAGFHLAAGSPGVARGSDGLAVGIR